MSSMLEQAIVDAKELKQAALNNAHQLVIEQFSDEVKKKMDSLLEVEGDLLGGDMGDPLMDDPLAGEGGPESDIFDEEGASTDDGNPAADDATELNLMEKIPLAALNGEQMGEYSFPDDDALIEIDLDSLSEENFKESLDESLSDEDFLTSLTEEVLSEMLDDEDLDGKDKEKAAISDLGEIEEGCATDHNKEEDVYEEGGCPFCEKKGSTCKKCASKESTEDSSSTDDVKKEDKLIDPKDVKNKKETQDESLEEAVKVDSKPAKEANAPFGGCSEQDQINLMLAELVEEAEELECELEKSEKKEKKVKKENLQLKKKIKSLKESLEKEKEKSKMRRETVDFLKEEFNKVQNENYKLVITNRVLSDSSLNERQKIKIVESLDGASSMEEAKIIYETLQGTMGETDGRDARNKSPESLSEVVGRRSSPLLMLKRRQVKKPENNLTTRWQEIAGLT